MNQVTRLLLAFVAPGVWNASELGPGDQDLATALGMRWQEVDLADVDSKAALMDRLATDLQLPTYFGKNWDGLEECLNDAPAPGVIVLKNANQLINNDLASAETLAEILGEVCERWSRYDGTRVSAVWVGGGPELTPVIPDVTLESPNTI